MKPVSPIQALLLSPFAILAFALILSFQNAPAEKEVNLNSAIKGNPRPKIPNSSTPAISELNRTHLVQ